MGGGGYWYTAVVWTDLLVCLLVMLDVRAGGGRGPMEKHGATGRPQTAEVEQESLALIPHLPPLLSPQPGGAGPVGQPAGWRDTCARPAVQPHRA